MNDTPSPAPTETQLVPDNTTDPVRQTPQSPDSKTMQQSAEEPLVKWTAPEFPAHQKTLLWYGALFGVALIIALTVWLLTHDKISTAVIIVSAIAMAGYAGRQPRQLQFAILRSGIQIGQKVLSYDSFRSFYVEGQSADSLALVPHRRFGQLITIYFDPRDQAVIVEQVAARLPLERRSADLIDRLLKKIRF